MTSDAAERGREIRDMVQAMIDVAIKGECDPQERLLILSRAATAYGLVLGLTPKQVEAVHLTGIATAPDVAFLKATLRIR